MNKPNYIFKVLTLSLLFIAVSGFSAEFCVHNSTELYSALTIAESNNQSDDIRIRSGSYEIDVSTFVYDATNTQETFDLKISGGWAPFFVECGIQFQSDAFDTILDGVDFNLIMLLKMAGHANLELSNLFFFRGNGPGGIGGALSINYPTGTQGDVLIENNAFLANAGNASTALYINIAKTATVRNNTFVSNHATTSGDIIRINSGAYGIYFTNNTVLTNTHDNPSAQTAVYLQFTAPSQAFVVNNVFWDNQDSDIAFFTSQGYSYFKNNNYQSIRNGTASINEFSGNFSLDPQFEPSILFNVPSITSPLINAGIKNPSIVGIPPDFDETWFIGDTDILEENRILDGRIDIGAYEAVRGNNIFKNSFE